jgi:hypothetical protein
MRCAGLHNMLPNQHLVLARELVRGHLEVQGGRATTNAARAIVVGTVAGAEPSVVVPSVGNGHAAQVGAHTQHNQPEMRRGGGGEGAKGGRNNTNRRHSKPATSAAAQAPAPATLTLDDRSAAPGSLQRHCAACTSRAKVQ